MMTKLYALFGAAVLLALAAADFAGWSPSDATEVKGVPRSVRDNPGSYRSSYGGGRHYAGGK
jgi:hypothetical protein